MKYIAITSALAITGVLGMHGMAQAEAAQAEFALTQEHFAQIDQNKDGRISKDEYEQFMRDAYKKLDTDGNQRLSRAETAKVLTPEQFDAVDANSDNEITLDELIARVMQDFDEHDYDGDGVLNP